MKQTAMTDAQPVVAGVDGSPSSLTAAEYAADLAVRRHAPLRLIHAYVPPFYSYHVSMLSARPDLAPSVEIDAALKDLAERLRQEHPKLPA